MIGCEEMEEPKNVDEKHLYGVDILIQASGPSYSWVQVVAKGLAIEVRIKSNLYCLQNKAPKVKKLF